MKELMTNTIYDAIDEAQTSIDLSKVDGMLEMFFLHINTEGVTYKDYRELCAARDRKLCELCEIH